MIRKFLDLSLQRKLTVIVVLATVSAMLLSSTAIIIYQVLAFRSQMVSELETTADILAENGAVALRFRVASDAEKTLGSLRAKEHVSGACFFTPDDELFAMYARDGIPPKMPPLPLQPGHKFSEDHLTLLKHIYQDGDFIGAIHLESELDVLDDQIRSSIMVTFLIIAVCASLALLLAFKLLRVVSQPITNLIDTANQVSQQRDYSLRAIKYGNDDLGNLVTEFNDMLQQIQVRDTELEQRVQVRTVELSETNERLSSSLEEKEVLLKEIHHRVKNNLQVISSLLSLQTRNIKDERDLEMFLNSQNRVKTMALIHERLYQSDDLSQVDFAHYIPTLVDSLFRTYKVSIQDIVMGVDVSDVRLGLDKAIPCGLMINELVSNALKYAFPDGRKGEINMYLGAIQIDGDVDGVELIVRDNGVGFPEDLDFRNTKSLGMELINILVRQLHGTITLENKIGTKFSIVFPRD
jgi:two-component sensor histidine kinase/HAMP domain-containing protein